MMNSAHQLDTIKLNGTPITLYQRGDVQDIVWHMRIKLKDEKKYIRQSTKEADFERAKEVAMERWVELKILQKHGFPIFNKSFSSVAKEVMAAIELREERGEIASETLRTIKVRMHRFLIPYFDRFSMDKITQKTVDDFWEWRINYWDNNKNDPQYKRISKPRPSYDSLLSLSVLLGQVFNLAIRQEVMKAERKPETTVPMKNDGRRRSALTHEEATKLRMFMNQWKETDRRTPVLFGRRRLYYAVIVAINSGMRPPEVYNLKWGDVELREEEGGDFKWTNLDVVGKGKHHQIQCGIRVWKFLEEWKKISKNVSTNDYVFANEDGKRARTFNALFKSALVAAGIPLEVKGEARTFYSCRHTYATNMLRQNVSVYSLSENMSTSVQNIENHYGQVGGSDRAKTTIPARYRVVL